MLANAESPGFWYSFISSRDRHVSRTFDAAQEIASALRRTVKAQGETVAVSSRDPLVVRELARCAERLGIGVERTRGDGMRGWSRGLGAWLRALAVFAWRVLDLARAIRMASPLRRVPPEQADVLVFTLFHTGRRLPELKRDSYRDIYFGDLPRWLAEQGKRVVLAGGCAQGERPVLAHLMARRDCASWLRPSIVDATWGDLAAAFRVAVFPGVRLPSLPLGGLIDLRPLVARDLASERDAILTGALLHRVALRLLRRHSNARILHVYENNFWERSTYRAAAAFSRSVVGYLHCAVLPGHLKNYAGQHEWAVRPHPQRIVTTGPDAAELLASLGSYPANMIVAGVALRDPPARVEEPTAPPQPGRVLVLLEGLMSMAPLLRLCHEAALVRTDLQIVVRAHPDLPAARISRDAGFDFDRSPLRSSDTDDLRADIAEAAVVVYQGTTAAITVGLLPRPLVRAALDARVDDDPLAGIDELKWQFSDLASLLAALDEALACPASRLERAATARAARILRRWSPPTPDQLEVFYFPSRS